MTAPELADAETQRISTADGATHRRARPRGAVRRTPPPPARVWPLVLALGVGTLVTIGLGAYGRLHTPTGSAINLAGFSSGLSAKSWLASGALVLVVVQLVTARPTWTGRRGAALAHRWSGRVAVLLTVPVAVHCLYALGFQDFDTRVLVHSAVGCLFYGAFVAKMLVLPRSGLPRWSVPVLGGLLLASFAAVWSTSALWFFTTSGLVP